MPLAVLQAVERCEEVHFDDFAGTLWHRQRHPSMQSVCAMFPELNSISPGATPKASKTICSSPHMHCYKPAVVCPVCMKTR